MAYLHCHNCDFSQDDFWNENYNPSDLDSIVEMDSAWLKERNLDFITRRELIYHLDQLKSRIANMKYRTMKEFKNKNPDGICPKCGLKELDID